MPLIPFPIFHPRIRLPSRHRPHSPSITYIIIPSLNSNSTLPVFFLRYSIHHSPLSYLQSILRLSLFPFPFFLSKPILIAMHLSHPLPISSPSFTHSIPILPFKSHPHRIASPSNPSKLFSSIHTFIPSFHFHSSFQNQSSSQCISLSSSSNPFSIIHTFISSRLSIFQS